MYWSVLMELLEPFAPRPVDPLRAEALPPPPYRQRSPPETALKLAPKRWSPPPSLLELAPFRSEPLLFELVPPEPVPAAAALALLAQVAHQSAASAESLSSRWPSLRTLLAVLIAPMLAPPPVPFVAPPSQRDPPR